MKRPNILFAFADDWGRYASAYRQTLGAGTPNDLVETPVFDRIAREGALFTNAFVPAPSCTPCRSSVLSGRYFWNTGLGAILSGAVWDESIPSYPLLLEAAGYHIGFQYKAWGPGTPPNAPYGGARTSYDQPGPNYHFFSQTVTKRAPEIGIEPAKEELYDVVRRSFNAFLAERKPGAPFCYWWGPTNTHRVWQRGSGKALWGLDPDALKGKMPAFLPDVHEVREDFADYLGEAQAYDAGLGVLIRRLEEIGELDNTLVVVSGDHGIPGFPRAKCNLYDIGSEVALAARLPGRIPAGRVIDDFVNLMDLTPTFLDYGGVPHPPGIDGRSLLGLLGSERQGQVDPERSWVVLGRERHVDLAREYFLPYPQRALRTRDFLYIRNFNPDRWPMGDPKGLDRLDATPPAFEELETNTYAAYPDMDAGPTKAWMIHHRAEEPVRPLFELAFGKRPGEELYDLRVDRHYMRNVADDPAYAQVKGALAAQLVDVLKAHHDPRLVEADCRFERLPYTSRPKAPKK